MYSTAQHSMQRVDQEMQIVDSSVPQDEKAALLGQLDASCLPYASTKCVAVLISALVAIHIVSG
jgi:hypothetical protein